jgi:hypothetical protein
MHRGRDASGGGYLNFYVLEQMEPQRALRDRASMPIRFENGYFRCRRGWARRRAEPEVLREHAFRLQPRTERTDTLYRQP